MPSSRDDSASFIDPELERLAESRSLAEELGVPLIFGPDELAPPVDMAQLRAFVRGELRGAALDETCEMIATFRTWYAAWGDAVADAANEPARGDV